MKSAAQRQIRGRFTFILGRVWFTLITEDPTVIVKCRTAIKALLLYFNLCPSVNYSFTSISYLICNCWFIKLLLFQKCNNSKIWIMLIPQNTVTVYIAWTYIVNNHYFIAWTYIVNNHYFIAWTYIVNNQCWQFVT